MSDIFISYKREEQPIARKLADALEGEGWSVWWDPKLRAGEHFDDVIEKALKEAKCVIVIWSERSLLSGYVRDEATYALEQNKLVPVAIANVDLPFRFKRIHTLNLQNWDGSSQSSEFGKLIEDISGLLGESQNRTVGQRVPDYTCAGRQGPYREQEMNPRGGAIETSERGSKLSRVIAGLVAVIFASVGTIVYLYTRPPKLSNGKLIEAQQQNANNLIQVGSQKAWFTCMQFNQVKYG
jgi:hypothetical protein